MASNSDTEVAGIVADWGSTNLRAWALSRTGTVIWRHKAAIGMRDLDSADYEPALRRALSPVLPGEGRHLPVLCCGMVGARQGWADAGYASAPCVPPGIESAVRPPLAQPDLSVHILPGVLQKDPPDVMRGEETQIRGFLETEPEFDGVLCLPGTHSKWVRISAGEIVSFQTFMTGELFDLISHHSVLRHDLSGSETDAELFADAVSEALSRPASIAAALFRIRAEALVGEAPKSGRSRLSGLLIGLELAAARSYWLGQDVAIIGEVTLAEAYKTALAAQGLTATTYDGQTASLAGLARGLIELLAG